MSRWVHPAWKALDIAPTGDTRAIRVAYSAKLKAIDPEADPKAFIALREAFEAAKEQAQWVDQPDDEDDDWDEAEGQEWAPVGDLYQIRPSAEAPPHQPDPAWETPAPPDTPAPPPEEPARRSPWAGVTPEDADAHSRALATLLYSHDRSAQPWPTDAQESEMLAHWRAITADPRMQEVSYYADADHWFSELIARTAAFSDPLVIPATDYFGWLRSDGTITQTPAIAYLTHRYKMLEFQRSVKNAKHPLNPAWRELVRPAGARMRRGSVDKRKVNQLIQIVRARYPDLEGCFDAERVALWDASQGGGGKGWLWTIAVIFFGIMLFGMLTPDKHGGSSQYPTGKSELANPIIDINDALDTSFGNGKLDLSAIMVRNPKLGKALNDYWREEKGRNVTQEEFAADVEAYLTNWYTDGVWRGSPDLLAAYHQLAIDTAKALRGNPAQCRRFMTGERLGADEFKLTQSFQDRQKALVLRAALETDGSEPHKGDTFSIPGEIVDAAAARAHMNRDALSAALLFKGSDANQCAGRIAFMESVLAMRPGKQRTQLMREM